MASKVYRQLPSAITHGLFDADQTLYAKSTGFESQHIVGRIYELVLDTMLKNGERATYGDAVEAAHRYYNQYHSSYVGLMKEYGLTMKDIVDFVYHNGGLNYSYLPNCATTRQHLETLRHRYNMRLAVLTNGTDLHGHSVIKAMGLEGLFGAVLGFNHNGYKPKPDHSTFRYALDEMNVANPQHVAIFEDALKNLKAATEMGFGYRVYIGEDEPEAPANADGYYDLWAHTLPEALEAINAMLNGEHLAAA